MTQPNFEKMNRDELKNYLLEHREDEAAFHAYMDKLATEPVLAHGTQEDAENSDRFLAIIEKAQTIKANKH
ncbi:DUF6887 family protein [Crocosphaera sp. XPORK-15E]|uniref:DUF6887 family protein n=1 Tax=Crocosphaera sp. XPORK-15E TaxID=3110247 RepID=UPI002B21ADDE|nr:hypothetical protein [Crocosphaera sp. XPORK-15E]MEA5536300.1 hypothetical protein [Crocosphaera sp. XPORK-15E]